MLDPTALFNSQKILEDNRVVINNANGILFNADCMDILQYIANETADTIFLDPPFNLNKDYGIGIADNFDNDIYLAWCRSWLRECIRIIKPGGAIFVYNLPKWNIEIAHFLGISGLSFRNWIAIEMKSRPPIKGRLYPSHYSLLYYTRGKPQYFYNPRIPIKVCRHCGREIKNYGGYRDKMKDNSVNVGDVWTDLSPVRHKKYKNRPANELPIEFIKRVIEISTPEHGIILDPFSGSGTTQVAAQQLDRHWIGIEIGDCVPAVERIENDRKSR